jgi:uncharacterized protein (DUF924 family)
LKQQEVLHFWFQELTPKQWWIKDPTLDDTIKRRFLPLHEAARTGELFSWRTSAEGRLAEILILDQFSRNIFRGLAESFAYDPVALVLAQEAVRSGADQKTSIDKRAFFYLPYMHSESLKIHQEALHLFSQKGLESNLDFERRHLEIIERFGRYPHRNEILKRSSTQEEIEFLKTPGSSF